VREVLGLEAPPRTLTASAPRYDLTVVGAGPTGLFAAFYAGLRGLSVAVLDSLPEPGGQITALYPEKIIRDVAGFPAVKGRDLVSSLVEQLRPFSTAMLLGRQATELLDIGDGFRIGFADGSALTTGAVVITGGIGTFTPRKLPCGEDYLGRGLSYFLRDPTELAGARVLVVGGGDSALDWASALDTVARDVTVVHRRSAFRAHEYAVARLYAGEATVMTETVLDELHGVDHVGTAVLRDTRTGEITRVPCDHVVAALGFTANLGPILDWGLAVTDRKIAVDQRMHTSRPGVFGAGDVVTYDGRVALIAVGFGEAATAVNHAVAWLDPTASTFPGHSTDTSAETPAFAIGVSR
jgi:thioredoxin reductase